MKRNIVRRTLGIISFAALLAGPAMGQAVRGTGTINVVPLWTSSSTIGNSVLSQSGGNLAASGAISATSFAGNGAALSNVNAATLGGILPSGFAQLGATSNAFTGSISATSFTGNGAALNNVNAVTLGGILPSGFAQLGATSNAFTGSISATSFTGNGAALSNVNAATLGGILPSGFAQLGASSNAFTGSLSVGGTLSANTFNSNSSYQIASTPVVGIGPGLFTLYVGQSAGQGAVSTNTRTQNTPAGYQTLFLNPPGSHNTAVGTSALYNNTTGSLNTAAGDFALNSNTTGYLNVALGGTALTLNTTGANNTAIGAYALDNLTAGLFNIAIGDHAGNNYTGTEFNNIDINNLGVAGESNVIRIGSSQTATYGTGILGETTGSKMTSTVLVDNNGQLGTIASSRRYKEDIHAMGAASDGLLRLRPVTFRYKKAYADGSQPIQYGLIAEEVAEVYPDLVVRGKDGQVETVQYYKLDAMLLNEMQKLAKEHADDQAEIAKLRSEVAEQRQQAQEQQATMKQLQDQLRVIRVALAHGRSADGNEPIPAAFSTRGDRLDITASK